MKNAFRTVLDAGGRAALSELTRAAADLESTEIQRRIGAAAVIGERLLGARVGGQVLAVCTFGQRLDIL